MNIKTFCIPVVVAMAGLILSATAYAQESTLTGNDLLIAAQKVCPVSGDVLHAMGDPVKAKSGDQTVFLCCKECLGKPIAKENWAKVTANLVSAQGRCPVMNRPLPAGATSVVVNGRRVFVCCPPCTGKIQSNPEKFLAVVDVMLAKNVGIQLDQ